MEVPADGLSGFLGITITIKRSEYLRMMRQKMATTPEVSPHEGCARVRALHS
jgi:hypothetical protein